MKSSIGKDSKVATGSAKPFFNKGGKDSFFSNGEQQTPPFFNATSIQPSLQVGLPNDPYEMEADQIANQVVGNFDKVNSIQRKLSFLGLQQLIIQPLALSRRISRKLQKTFSKSPLTVQTKCSHCEQEEQMQEKSGDLQFAGEGSEVSADVEKQIQSMRGGGQTLDSVTKSLMDNSFGADFSKVRVHNNSQAVQMSQRLNAHAFTVGSDVFFNQGRYQPQSKLGAGLLAHELAHTIQQGAVLQTKTANTVSDTSDLVTAQAPNNMVSFGSIERVAGHEKKAMLKERSGLKLQRCPSGSPVMVRYRKYGGTAFGVESGGGSCPAYCACNATDETGNPITAGEARYVPRPINGRCPPGLQIVWHGSIVKSVTPLEAEPCGPGETRSGCS